MKCFGSYFGAFPKIAVISMLYGTQKRFKLSLEVELVPSEFSQRAQDSLVLGVSL